MLDRRRPEDGEGQQAERSRAPRVGRSHAKPSALPLPEKVRNDRGRKPYLRHLRDPAGRVNHNHTCVVCVPPQAVSALMLGVLPLVRSARAAGPPYQPPFGPWSRLHGGEPILVPQGSGSEANGVFNPAVIQDGGRYVMLYRAQDGKGTSRLGRAVSEDGIHFRARRGARPGAGGALRAAGRRRRPSAGEDRRDLLPDLHRLPTERTPSSGASRRSDLRRWERRGVIMPANMGRWNVKWTKAGGILPERRWTASDAHGRRRVRSRPDRAVVA